MATLTQMFDALRGAGLPVRGIVLPDLGDPTTWRFDGLDAGQTAQAVTIVSGLDATLAQQDLDAQTAKRISVALVAYIWKVTHNGTNPTLAQLQGELDKLKTIYRALP